MITIRRKQKQYAVPNYLKIINKVISPQNIQYIQMLLVAIKNE